MLQLLGRVFTHATSAVPAVLVVTRGAPASTTDTASYPTNESRDVRHLLLMLLSLSLLIFAARKLQLHVMSGGRRSRHTLDDVGVMVYGVGERWIAMLVTATVAVLPGRLSTIQVSYAADRTHICFPFHNEDVDDDDLI